MAPYRCRRARYKKQGSLCVLALLPTVRPVRGIDEPEDLELCDLRIHCSGPAPTPGVIPEFGELSDYYFKLKVKRITLRTCPGQNP